MFSHNGKREEGRKEGRVASDKEGFGKSGIASVEVIVMAPHMPLSMAKGLRMKYQLDEG